ncbi:hypothetical protein DYB28_013084, partial [Aphanomyces astaci]
DVQCDGSAGRHAVNAMWLQWATLFPGYQLSVVVIDVVAADNATANLTVRVEVQMTLGDRTSACLQAPHWRQPTDVALQGYFMVQFDGGSGGILSLQPQINFAPAFKPRGLYRRDRDGNPIVRCNYSTFEGRDKVEITEEGSQKRKSRVDVKYFKPFTRFMARDCLLRLDVADKAAVLKPIVA